MRINKKIKKKIYDNLRSNDITYYCLILPIGEENSKMYNRWKTINLRRNMLFSLNIFQSNKLSFRTLFKNVQINREFYEMSRKKKYYSTSKCIKESNHRNIQWAWLPN